MTAEPDILVTDSPGDTDRRAVRDGLAAYNERFLGPADHRPLTVLARGADGALRGGLIGETVRGFLHVDLLWVAEDQRGRGLGSRLLRAAEAAAASRGCGWSELGTYDFQARPFYERHGYGVVGTAEPFPQGRRSFMMRKRLQPE